MKKYNFSGNTAAGFTLIEVLVVMAVVMILGVFSFAALQGSRRGNNSAVAARLVASSIREAQNNALTGKQFSATNISCGHGFYVESANVFKLFYNRPAGSGCADPATSKIYSATSVTYGTVNIQDSYKTSFSSPIGQSVYFTMPRGEAYQTGGILIGSSPMTFTVLAGGKTVRVCVYSSGKVKENC